MTAFTAGVIIESIIIYYMPHREIDSSFIALLNNVQQETQNKQAVKIKIIQKIIQDLVLDIEKMAKCIIKQITIEKGISDNPTVGIDIYITPILQNIIRCKHEIIQVG